MSKSKLTPLTRIAAAAVMLCATAAHAQSLPPGAWIDPGGQAQADAIAATTNLALSAAGARTPATTTGAFNVAIGFGSSATGGGRYLYTTDRYPGAEGVVVQVIEAGSLAVGTYARATAQGSVALGSYSIADQAYTVSLGGPTITRRLVNVADGVAASDGATVGQAQRVADAARSAAIKTATGYTDQATALVYTYADTLHGTALASIDVLDGRVTGLDGRVGGLDGRLGAAQASIDVLDGRVGGLDGRVGTLEGRVDGLDGRVGAVEDRMAGMDKRIDAAAAMSAALSSAQMPSLAPGERAIVAGLGASGGESALAAGVVIAAQGGAIYSARLALSSRGRSSIGAGAGFRF